MKTLAISLKDVNPPISLRGVIEGELFTVVARAT
jgi:hypothetical protein